ncbi:MAG TPA: type VI secretion system tube protein Hcp [Pyrinomonadaceae bacterium]|jgi:type VI secretion system secreted protein Hcp
MAAVDYFLKIEGVDGESHDSKHKGEIDLESFSWGESQTGSHAAGGGGGAGKVAMQDFHFVMRVNKASPKLMLGCATGEHFKKAVLICRKAGKEQQEFLKVTMSDVLISSYQTGGSAHGETLPMDQCALNFAKIEFEYKEQKADGSLAGPVKAGYDMKANKVV